MQRFARQFLLASLLALYGVTALCGPALHALPGAGHVKAVLLGEGAGPDQPTSPDNDCPICHFLVQGQESANPALIPSLDVAQIRPVGDMPLTFPPPTARPSAPRAPPFA